MATRAHEQDLIWVFNPTDSYFEVEWGKRPYGLEAKTKKIFPRFIAEHFAKHLADHILIRLEEKERLANEGKYTPLLNHPVERPKVVNSIILGVYSQYDTQKQPDLSEQAAQIVNQANENVPQDQVPADPNESYEDLGAIENKAVGTLVEPPAPIEVPEEEAVSEIPQDHALEEAVAPAPEAEPKPQGKPKRTKKQLVDEAQQLGIEITGKETVEELEFKLKNF